MSLKMSFFWTKYRLNVSHMAGIIVCQETIHQDHNYFTYMQGAYSLLCIDTRPYKSFFFAKIVHCTVIDVPLEIVCLMIVL